MVQNVIFFVVNRFLNEKLEPTLICLTPNMWLCSSVRRRASWCQGGTGSNPAKASNFFRLLFMLLLKLQLTCKDHFSTSKHVGSD